MTGGARRASGDEAIPRSEPVGFREPRHLHPFAAEPLGFRPLYRQVYETLLRRLADAVWQPGQLLPSEGQLAVELRVSQGTVRKALDALTADSLLVRRQGRGTFVAEHGDTQSVFRFFKLRPDAGTGGIPESRVLTIAEGVADEDERMRLYLQADAVVTRIERLRWVAGELCVVELRRGRAVALCA